MEAHPDGDAENAIFDPARMAAPFSVISVRKGSGLTSTNDLKGTAFTVVNLASPSGSLIPANDLVGVGSDPTTDKRLDLKTFGD